MDSTVSISALENNECAALSKYSEIKLCWEEGEKNKYSGIWEPNTSEGRKRIAYSWNDLMVENLSLGLSRKAWVEGR